MFVTACNNVNIRLNNPQVASPCGGYIPINTQVEVINIVAGQVIDGNSIWYISRQNQYLWSGGFVNTSDLLLVNGQLIILGQNVLMAVYSSAVKELTTQFKSNYQWCTGLSFGPVGNGFSLFIYTNYPITGAAPPTINYRGITISVAIQVTRGINACSIFRDLSPPLFMGGTISDPALGNNQYGSRTAYIQLNKSGKYLLTCYHVACASLMASKQTSYQPGGLVNIPAPVSNSQTATKQFPIHEGYLDTYSDYAIVDVSGQDLQFQNQLPDEIGYIEGYYTVDEIPSKLAGIQSLKIFGASSGHTVGKIVHYYATALTVNYKDEGFGSMDFYGLITANNPCLSGDSGAPALDQDNKLLGYVIAVDNFPGGNCYIMPIANLFFNDTVSLI